MAIDEFQGEYRFLSNFWACGIEIENVCWPTAEHAYQALKAVHTHDRLRIAEAGTPGQAKRLGQSIVLRPDWEGFKKRAMLLVLVAKFTQHPELASQLAGTGDQLLVEGNCWHDNYWGRCSCPRCRAGGTAGLNYLGRLLMAVRDVVRLD
jgi:ribA/ribD-fused uncharacterized protein